MIRLGTQQLGNKLVRLFGRGDEMKRVVTETVDGKIFTHVYSAEGKPIVSHAKQILEPRQVGDKFVRTKKVLESYYGDPKYWGDPVTKCTVDRVYKTSPSGENTLCGKRRVYSLPDGSKSVEKHAVGSEYTVKKEFYDSGKPWYRSVTNKKGCGVGDTVYYNDKGLPIPQQGMTCLPYKGKSLAEMKSEVYSYKENRGLSYANSPGLEHLDVVDAKVITHPMGDLTARNNEISSLFDKLV